MSAGRTWFLMLWLVLVALIVCACGTAGPKPVQWNDSALSRIVSGDLPRTPKEAQKVLDEVTRQVRQLEAAPRAYCAVACRHPEDCPPACHKAEDTRKDLSALREIFQQKIDLWTASGGSASEAATAAFRDFVATKNPELAALLDMLAAWRGEDVPDAPIVPAGGAK